jgi:hypothetical protein
MSVVRVRSSQASAALDQLRGIQSALAGTNPERHLFRTRPDTFYRHSAATDAPKTQSRSGILEAWWPAIETAILIGLNGMSPDDEQRSRGRILGIHDFDLFMLTRPSCRG